MGQYYTINGNNLYIYVTGNDLLLDLKLFPKDLHLFDSESTWRMTDKIAVVNGARDSDIVKAEIILSMNAYKALDQPERILETYFTTSDEAIFDELELPEEDDFIVKEIQKEFDVIIPAARPPTVDYSKLVEEAQQPEPPIQTIDEDVILEKVLKRIEENLGKQEKIRPLEQVPQQNMIPIKAFEETVDLFNMMLQKISTTPDTVSRVETSLEALNLKLSEYLSDSRKIQEMQLEAWNTSLDRLTGILAGNMEQKEAEKDEVNELERKIDELLGVPKPAKQTVKVTQPELIIDVKNPLEGILASLLNKNETVQVIPQKSAVQIESHTVEKVKLDNQLVSQDLKETYRYIAYSKYFPEIEQHSSEALETLESNWNQSESIIIKISENPQVVDLEALPEIERMTPENAKKMMAELEALKGRIKGLDERLSGKLEELLQRLERKQSEKPRRSPYDITENRMLKKGLQYLQEDIESLLNHLEYSTQYIMKTLKSSDYSIMESLAQSLLDNRSRLQRARKIKENMLKTLSQDTFAFLEEVESDWTISEGSTLGSQYNSFHELMINYQDQNRRPFELGIQKHSDSPDRLYENWCFVKIVEEAILVGYSILDDNVVKITENLDVIHNTKSIISMIREDIQLRVYYTDSDPLRIKVETLENDKIRSSISFHPLLERMDSLKSLGDEIILVPYDGVKITGVARLVPGDSSSSLREYLNSIL